MRSTLRGLTLRGRALLSAGVALALVAVALGQRDLVRVAALLVALPLVAAVVLARRDDRVTVVRTLEPAQVPVGGDARVRLTVRNAGGRTAGPLLVTDSVDPALGATPQVVIESLAPSTWTDTSYTVEARTRGRHRIGPLTLSLEDPFGLVRNARTAATSHTLIVTPVVTPLRHGPAITGRGGSGDGSARRTAAAGQDDVGTRQYRPGDELRRVHWRSTARTGSMMVRQEEQPWEAQALVLLDTRVGAHNRVVPTLVPDLATSSFEWGIHAAASIGAHLAATERRVRIVTGTSDVIVTGGATAPMLDALAVLRTTKDGLLVPQEADRATTPVVVAVLGALDLVDLRRVAALRKASTTGVAVVLDVDSWSRPLRPPAAATTADLARDDELAAPLVNAGWRVAVAHRGDDIDDVWNRVTR